MSEKISIEETVRRIALLPYEQEKEKNRIRAEEELKRLTDLARTPVKDTLIEKYPAAAEVADLIIRLGYLGEQYTELTKERNDLQDKATAEIDEVLEAQIAYLNKEIERIKDRQAAIEKEINDLWLKNRIDTASKLKYPDFEEWENELVTIAKGEIDKVREKFKNVYLTSSPPPSL